MIRWYSNLYLDEKSEEHVETWKNQLKQNKAIFNVYCITLASNPSNLFDIISTRELVSKFYQKKEIAVIGMAYSKRSAIQLIIKMVDEINQNTDDFDAHGYLAKWKDELYGR